MISSGDSSLRAARMPRYGVSKASVCLMLVLKIAAAAACLRLSWREVYHSPAPTFVQPWTSIHDESA